MIEKELNLIYARIDDLVKSVATKHRVVVTPFMDPAISKGVEALLRKAPDVEYHRTGGFPSAERNVFVMYPFYMDKEKIDNPLKVVKAEWNSDYYYITHRDVLGSVMGLGIKREKIGDIILYANYAQIITVKDIAPYIGMNLKSIGKASVRVYEMDCSELVVPEPKVKTIRATVASLRLDSLISSGYGISRNKAIPIIKNGNVRVNWEEVNKPDFMLSVGDLISLRGHGRVRLKEINGTTKKERINITLERFL